MFERCVFASGVQSELMMHHGQALCHVAFDIRQQCL